MHLRKFIIYHFETKLIKWNVHTHVRSFGVLLESNVFLSFRFCCFSTHTFHPPIRATWLGIKPMWKFPQLNSFACSWKLLRRNHLEDHHVGARWGSFSISVPISLYMGEYECFICSNMWCWFFFFFFCVFSFHLVFISSGAISKNKCRQKTYRLVINFYAIKINIVINVSV